jgi:hypothetical protein
LGSNKWIGRRERLWSFLDDLIKMEKEEKEEKGRWGEKDKSGGLCTSIPWVCWRKAEKKAYYMSLSCGLRTASMLCGVFNGVG